MPSEIRITDVEDFEGEPEMPGAAGSSTLEVQGSVDLDERKMSLQWIASSGMGAVVDGQSFASANSEAWDAELEVSLDGA